MTELAQIRVLLVDDHPIVRMGIEAALSLFPDIRVVGQAKDGEEVFALCTTFQPDVVLMDLRMPHVDGLEATRRIRNQFPRIQVIVFTSFPGQDTVQQALQAGAISFLIKDASPQVLAAAVRSAAAGKRTLAPDILDALVDKATQTPAAHSYALTEREVEVLLYVVDGWTNQEIASKLGVSVNTIRHHVRGILMKLAVTNRTAAAKVALEEQLIPRQSDSSPGPF